MDYLALLSQIFEVCIIPLLGLLTTFLVSYLKTKTQEVKETSQNELVSKYVDMLNDTITNCVIATNQTYVDALKKEGKFDTDAQKEAFNLTYQAVMNILTEDAQNYLTAAFGDLTTYLNSKIEAEVNQNK